MNEHHPRKVIGSPADEAQFLSLLVKILNAKNTMEIGVFTGYSLLSIALGLPDDGKVVAIDLNREDFELGLPIMEKAGVAHKIDFREGLALPVFDQLVQDLSHFLGEANHGKFDFIFVVVDADKENYLDYHKRAIELVKVGAVIGYDNSLWFGTVVAAEDDPSVHKTLFHYTPFVLEINKALTADPSIEISMLTAGDGITLLRRLY